MKEFNFLKVNMEEISGLGTYCENDDHIFINTNDEQFVRKIDDLKEKSIEIISLEFSGFNNDEVFNGTFIIESIFTNQHTRFIEINIRKCKDNL